MYSTELLVDCINAEKNLRLHLSITLVNSVGARIRIQIGRGLTRSGQCIVTRSETVKRRTVSTIYYTGSSRMKPHSRPTEQGAVGLRVRQDLSRLDVTPAPTKPVFIKSPGFQLHR